MKKKPAPKPARFNPKFDPDVFHPDTLTKEDAKDLFDRLWEINEVSSMCQRMTRLTGRTHQWSFSQGRPADADEPLYQIYAEVGPRTTGSLRMVEHMVSGPCKAIATYALGIVTRAKVLEDLEKPAPVPAKVKAVSGKKVKKALAPQVKAGPALLTAARCNADGPKFSVGATIVSDGVERVIAKALRHGSTGWKYRMDDGSVWTQAQLAAIIEK